MVEMIRKREGREMSKGEKERHWEGEEGARISAPVSMRNLWELAILGAVSRVSEAKWAQLRFRFYRDLQLENI